MKACELESAVISSRRVGFGDYITIRKGQLHLGHQSNNQRKVKVKGSANSFFQYSHESK